MKATWKVGGDEKVFKRLDIVESVSEIGDWSAERDEVENLVAFTTITVEREGVEIFGGRVERPGIDFSRAGSEIKPSGFDYTIKLTDYLAPKASIVDTPTAAALATIITNTPFALSIESAFSYISDLITFETTLEFLGFTFSNACIEYDLEETELDHTIRLNAVSSLGFGGGSSCFYYDGATKRFYVFYIDVTGDDLYYEHSVDGVNWIQVDTGLNPRHTGEHERWSVAWYNNKVWLFVMDDDLPHTDLWRGTINDGTGTIAWDGGFNPVNNIFSDNIQAGPVFDDTGHIWVIQDDGLANHGYESTDNGATWNLRFSGDPFPVNETILGILPVGVDGDMYVFVMDAPNGDLEEWLWDRSAGTFTFQVKIEDIDAFIAQNAFDCASFIDYVPALVWETQSGADAGLWYADKTGGAWNTHQLIDVNLIIKGNPGVSISCDQGITAYVFANIADGPKAVAYKIIAGVPGPQIDLGFSGFVQSPRTCLQDGEILVFLEYLDASLYPHFRIFGPTGIRLTRGQANGWFRSTTITASAAIIQWGYCVGAGVELEDCAWSVLKASTNALLGTGGQHVPFDIDAATDGTAETEIKIRVDLTDTGVDPYVFFLAVSEVIDEVTLDLDYEDVYTALRKWIALSGGEIWLDSGDVLHVAATRGSDKSDRVILKNSKTSDYPEVEPNIMVVSRDPDWAPYANAIQVIGAGTGDDRVEATVRDQAAIDEWGEHWYPHRNPDIQTVGAAYTVGTIELARRSVVIDRIIAIILDEYDPGDIGIGDTVHVVAEFGDNVATKLDADMRVVSLSRSWDAGGEHVTLELINLVLASEYWRYLTSISDLMRWITT